MRPSWLCYQLSFNNQIWCRDSFQEGSNITFQDGEGEIHPSSDTERQKSPANSGGTIV